jgi:hypothetical protein
MPDEPMLASWRQDRAKQDEMIRQRKAALDSLIGKPAPELPAGKWYNSKPLAWKDLRGKTVIVDFPGPTYTCPSGRDLVLMDALDRHKAKTRLHGIVIHAASSPARHLELAALDPDESVPFCQDVPGSNPANEGATHERYQIATGPYAFVVGPDGKVVHHGLLPELPEVRVYCEKLPPLWADDQWEHDLSEGSGQATAKPAK